MSEIISGAASGLVIGILGYLFGKKKRSAETHSSELDNVEKALRIYQTIVEDMQKRINSLEEEVHELQRELKTLRTTK